MGIFVIFKTQGEVDSFLSHKDLSGRSLYSMT